MEPAMTYLLGVLCLLIGATYAQNARPTPEEAQPPDRIQMIECEGFDNCTAWTFQNSATGWKGHAEWRTGEQAVLELASGPDGKIVVNRTDVIGKKAGLTATYHSDSLRGDHLGGEFTSSFQGKLSSGNWYAFLGTAELEPPNVLHFCNLHCFTFTAESPRQLTNYTPWPGETNHQKRAFVIEKFTYNLVVIHRIDSGSHPYARDYIGRMSDDGSSVRGEHGETWVMTWGPRLNDLPQDDQERDRRSGRQQQIQVPQFTIRDFIDSARLVVDVLQLYSK